MAAAFTRRSCVCNSSYRTRSRFHPCRSAAVCARHGDDRVVRRYFVHAARISAHRRPEALQGLPYSRSTRPLSRLAAMTESAELPLGTTAPGFELLEPLTGETVSLAKFDGAKALLVIFMCNHCPFVKHLKAALVQLAKDYEPQGVQLVAISANSVQSHPQDGPEKMAEDARQQGYPFPYLYDESQSVAKAYQAACTPEFYVFDGSLKLQYHGQFDSSRPSSDRPVTGEDVRQALDNILNGCEPAVKVKPSIGCNIKWTPGNEPAYFAH